MSVIMVTDRRVDTLGQFEQLVLAAVQAIENPYPVPVHTCVEELYGRRVRFAAVYTALARLEAKGYVQSKPADHPVQRRGHLPKRYYTMTPEGERALEESAETAERFLRSVRAHAKVQSGN
jgi:DNA-binding PadR family transcriptional regulator